MASRLTFGAIVLLIAAISGSFSYTLACDEGANNWYRLSSHWCNSAYGVCQY